MSLTRSVALALSILAVVAARAGAAKDPWRLPLGLDRQAAMIPDDNPMTAEKIALGKPLVWDKRWSRDGTVACVSCHLPEHGWSDPRHRSVHVGGQPTLRHSPTLVNRVFSDRQGWTGFAASIEHFVREDALFVVGNLRAIPAYEEALRRMFGTGPTQDTAIQAVAAYVRMIVSGNSPYDRFRAGNADALSAAARRGLALFETKARCARCHAGFNFTDESYHNIGVGMDKDNPDLGRFQVSKREINKGAFKTPTLRDVARRAPYMHDARFATLREVVAFYDRGGIPSAWLSPEMAPLGLTPDQQEDLVAFLEALTGEVPPDVATPPVLP